MNQSTVSPSPQWLDIKQQWINRQFYRRHNDLTSNNNESIDSFTVATMTWHQTTINQSTVIPSPQWLDIKQQWINRQFYRRHNDLSSNNNESIDSFIVATMTWHQTTMNQSTVLSSPQWLDIKQQWINRQFYRRHNDLTSNNNESIDSFIVATMTWHQTTMNQSTVLPSPQWLDIKQQWINRQFYRRHNDLSSNNNESIDSFTVATMTWLNVKAYISNDKCRNHNLVLFSIMT
jgi:hypothetical protein